MDSVKDLLADPLKGKKHAQGILCYLFREVLLWRKVNYFTWSRLLTMYFERPHNAVKPDKGNLNKALILAEQEGYEFIIFFVQDRVSPQLPRDSQFRELNTFSNMGHTIVLYAR